MIYLHWKSLVKEMGSYRKLFTPFSNLFKNKRGAWQNISICFSVIWPSLLYIIKLWYTEHNCRKATHFLIMISLYQREREGTIYCLYHLSPKSYIDVFLFVGSTTLGTFILIDLFIKLDVQTFQPVIEIYRSDGFCI